MRTKSKLLAKKYRLQLSINLFTRVGRVATAAKTVVTVGLWRDLVARASSYAWTH